MLPRPPQFFTGADESVVLALACWCGAVRGSWWSECTLSAVRELQKLKLSAGLPRNHSSTPSRDKRVFQIGCGAHKFSYALGTGGVTSWTVKWPGHKDDCLYVFGVEVKNMWRYTTIPPYFMVCAGTD
jgi:hypothetical protein